jgi:hypothetical protein
MKIWILKTDFLKPHYYRKPTKKNPCYPWFKTMEKPILENPIITENPIV